MKNDEQLIAIVGLGYVGLPLAVEFGKQRPVLGFKSILPLGAADGRL